MTKIKNDEITLTGIILFLLRYYRLLMRRWYIVGLFCAVFGGYYLYKAFKTIPSYAAKITFMLSDGEKGGLGAFAGLLGQFGLGGGSSGDGNMDRIVEIAHSNRILKTTLFSRATINGKTDLFANHFIDKLKLHEEWKTDTLGLPNFKFTNDNFETFSRLENYATDYLLSIIKSQTDPLYSCSFAKLSGILTLSFKSPNDELTYAFLNTAFTNLSDFYVSKTTERERQTFELIKASRDSIYNEMRSKERSAAQFRDYNRGLVMESEKVRGDQLTKDAQIATVAYGEGLKQFAIADFALKSNTPFIQSIDTPTLPILPKKASKRKALMMGFALGFALSTGLIIGWDVVKKALQEVKKLEQQALSNG